MTRIQILHTNDTHSRFERMPAIAGLLKQLRANHDGPSLTVDIGDHIDRSNRIAEGTSGVANVNVLNESGYQYFVPGNNEGLALTHGQLADLFGQQATFSTLGSNFIELDSGRHPSWCKPYDIIEMDGIKLALFGITASLQRYYRLLKWDVKDPIAVIEAAMQDVRGEVDAVIVLSHCGKDVDARLAEAVPGITCIIGGHTHHVYEQAVMVNGAAICGAGKFGQYVGEITLTFDSDKYCQVEAKVHETKMVEPDIEIQALIQHYEQLAVNHLTHPIATLSREIPHHYGEDSVLGNLLAQAVRTKTGADFALINNGQFLQGFVPGDVSKEMLLTRCPSPVQVCRMWLKGEQIRLTLEESLLEEFQQFRFQGYGFRGEVLGGLSVDGLEVLYDPQAPPMQRIREIRVDGSQLDDEKSYLLGTLDLFTFGVGYKRLREGMHMEFYLPSFIRDVLAPVLNQEEEIANAHRARWMQG